MQMVQSGYCRHDRVRRGPRTRHLPLPASATLAALRRFLAHGEVTAVVRGDAVVTADFLLMARPSSVLALRTSDVTLHSTEITIRLLVSKGDGAGLKPTRVVTLLLRGSRDIVRLFWQELLAFSRLSHFFASVHVDVDRAGIPASAQRASDGQLCFFTAASGLCLSGQVLAQWWNICCARCGSSAL